jgi:folate-binding protein YgfZ
MRQSGLTEAYKHEARRFVDHHGWEMPESFSSSREELHHLSGGVGLTDSTFVGRLEAAGKDRVDLLHRLSTNDLSNLQQGDLVGTIITTDKGRIEALLLVVNLGERLLVVTSPGSEERVEHWIARYTILEDFKFQQVTSTTVMTSLIGFGVESINEIGSHRLSDGLGSWSLTLPWGDVLAVRVRLGHMTQIHLISDAAHALEFWSWLREVARLQNWELIGVRAYETYRIMQGVPEGNHELTGDFNPYDANLLEFVSFTKGCYIGQEVIARIDAYQKNRHSLRGLLLDSFLDTYRSPMEILRDAKGIGWLTSVSPEPVQGIYPGLGVLRNGITDGTTVEVITASGEIKANVVSLPMRLDWA